MKFGKSLNNQIVETLPDWRDKFLSYKNLKKHLKLIADARAVERQSKRQRVGSGNEGGSPPSMTPEEAGFVCLLEAELEKFNAFFLGKEEDYVIRQKELQDRVVRAAETGSAEKLMRVGKEIVDFHGEIVLLVNYSALNYTGKRNIVGVEDKTDMSADYDKFDEIPPFTVKTDPSIPLNNEDAPWLRPKRS